MAKLLTTAALSPACGGSVTTQKSDPGVLISGAPIILKGTIVDTTATVSASNTRIYVKGVQVLTTDDTYPGHTVGIIPHDPGSLTSAPNPTLV